MSEQPPTATDAEAAGIAAFELALALVRRMVDAKIIAPGLANEVMRDGLQAMGIPGLPTYQPRSAWVHRKVEGAAIGYAQRGPALPKG